MPKKVEWPKVCQGNCGRMLRPKNTNEAVYPNTIPINAKDMCSRCYAKDYASRKRHGGPVREYSPRSSQSDFQKAQRSAAVKRAQEASVKAAAARRAEKAAAKQAEIAVQRTVSAVQSEGWWRGDLRPEERSALVTVRLHTPLADTLHIANILGLRGTPQSPLAARLWSAEMGSGVRPQTPQ